MKKLLLCASVFALMLGSCSKDDTEVAPVNGNNEVIFTAGMTIGSETRTGIAVDPNNNNGTVYTWDVGDMVGVSVAEGKVVPFINIGESGSATAKFTYSENDADYVGEGNAAYFVYPYNEANLVSGRNGQVSLTIPAEQRYRDDSFAPMTAPAVAYSDSFKKGEDYTFKAVTSFIRVPLIGNGKLKGLKMQIENGSGNLKIAGSNVVSINSTTPQLTVPTSADSWTDAISIDFGNGGLDLSYNEMKYVVFVVPADLAIKANTNFMFTATLENADVETSTVTYRVPATYKQTKLPVNIMVTLASKEGLSFGTERQVIITDANDFLKYAYAASHTSTEASGYYYNDGGDKLKSAVLLNNIDFASFKGGDVYASAGEDAVLKSAADWYIDNGDCFVPFANATIIGAGKDGVEISNLKVKGAGIFGAKMTLNGITITNAVVDANKTATASLIGTLPTATNVTFNGGTIENLPEGTIAAMLNTATSNSSLGKVDVTYSDNIQLFARTLTVAGNVDFTADGMEGYCNAKRFGLISASSKDGYVITVADPTEASYILESVNAKSGKAFSVVDKETNTSYWTGLTPTTAPVAAAPVTAEALAYYVNNGATELVKLTNNIDLRKDAGLVWTVANTRCSLDGAKSDTEKYTIKNAKLVTDDEATGTVYYSLLGGTVTASNLNVEDVDIVVSLPKAGKLTARIGGLAYSGSANNVSVDGMNITVGEGVKVSGIVGGMFATMNKSSVKNIVTNLSMSGGDDVKFAGMFGTIGSATYKFDDNTVEYTGANAYAMVDTWTIKDNASVAKCSNVAAIVENVKFAPTDAGQIISLVFDECTEPYYTNLVNTMPYEIAIEVTGKDGIQKLPKAE